MALDKIQVQATISVAKMMNRVCYLTLLMLSLMSWESNAQTLPPTVKLVGEILITADRQKMGHVDELRFQKGSMMLYLPKWE